MNFAPPSVPLANPVIAPPNLPPAVPLPYLIPVANPPIPPATAPPANVPSCLADLPCNPKSNPVLPVDGNISFNKFGTFLANVNKAIIMITVIYPTPHFDVASKLAARLDFDEIRDELTNIIKSNIATLIKKSKNVLKHCLAHFFTLSSPFGIKYIIIGIGAIISKYAN